MNLYLVVIQEIKKGVLMNKYPMIIKVTELECNKVAVDSQSNDVTDMVSYSTQ